MNTLDHDPELDQRLRRTLAAVAATVDAEPDPVGKPSRSHRKLAIVAGVTIAAVPLAAGAWVQFGPRVPSTTGSRREPDHQRQPRRRAVLGGRRPADASVRGQPRPGSS